MLMVWLQRQRAQNVLPVTVAQILSAQQDDDTFTVGGVELHQVRMGYICFMFQYLLNVNELHRPQLVVHAVYH